MHTFGHIDRCLNLLLFAFFVAFFAFGAAIAFLVFAFLLLGHQSSSASESVSCWVRTLFAAGVSHRGSLGEYKFSIVHIAHDMLNVRLQTKIK